jgi:tRNA pseudouridine55 synthase
MNGVLPVDKPVGPTSHDIVAIARRGLGIRRIGHTGTLDPFASGLMLLCLGQATRLAEYLSGLDKTYEATARLGVRTDTQDRTGVVLDRTDAWRDLSRERVRAAFEGQVGERLQTPPAFSAKKIAGRRAYHMAREGERVDLDPVTVKIEELRILALEGSDVRFRLRCSSGTYVRTVAADAGDMLGVGAHLMELRRTAVGSFSLEGALGPHELADADAAAEALVPPLRALDHMPRVEVTAEEATSVRHGRSIPAGDRARAEGRVALAFGGDLLAIADHADGLLLPRKVFG